MNTTACTTNNYSVQIDFPNNSISELRLMKLFYMRFPLWRKNGCRVTLMQKDMMEKNRIRTRQGNSTIPLKFGR